MRQAIAANALGKSCSYAVDLLQSIAYMLCSNFPSQAEANP